MFYTLLKFLGWGALLAVIGGCIGWALRALKGRSELARAVAVDEDELSRMRHRLANLESVVAERDRLRILLADVRHADSPGIVGAEVPAAATDPVAAHDAQSEPGWDVGGSAPEVTGSPAGGPSLGDVVDNDVADNATAEASGAALDLGAAADVLGKRIKLDDLTVVEGIGPKISELCRGIGATTWSELADTDVADLQSMLDAAGSRYTVHKPGTWPSQAGLLAAGRWEEFAAMTNELKGGR